MCYDIRSYLIYRCLTLESRVPEHPSKYVQGDLKLQPLADVIRALYVARRSGILHLSRGEIKKRIYLRKGSMIFANSDVDSDRLGEFLIRSGVISREDFEIASRKMQESGGRLGRTLVGLAYVSAEAMQERVVEQIQTIIYSLFEWDSGNYRFEANDNPVDEDIVLNLSTADIVLEGTRRMNAPERVRAALGSHDRILHPTEDPLLLYQKMTTLTQSEYFVLSRVDGSSAIADIVSLSPIDEDETLRCIYGLLSAGVVELKEASGEPVPVGPKVPAPRKPGKQARAAAAEPPPMGPGPGRDLPRPDLSVRPSPSSPSGSPSAGGRGSGPARGTPDEISIREDIIEKHAALSQASLYDLLGIGHKANDAEIKKAYYAMAKKYHPDRHHSPQLRDVHGLLEELFGKITQAYQVLSSTGERLRYDAKLKAEAASTDASDAASEEARRTEEASEAARKRSADEQFRDAQRHYDEMHFFDAIQCLKEAIRLYPSKKSHKLLALSLVKNPKWVKEAEEHFREALKFDQFDPECYIGLGDIYESAGMSTRAQKMYEQAASYDPDNENLVGKLHNKRADSSLGGIAKIFGRKKT